MSLPKVLICVLSGSERTDWINPELFNAALRLQKSTQFDVTIETIDGVRPVDRARNLAVMKARAANVDWLVQIDNDNVLPPENGLLDAIAQAGPRQDVIVLPYGIYTDNGLRWSCNFLEPFNGQPFIRIDDAGTGVMILRNTVWKRLIAGPWFETRYTDDGELGRKIKHGEDVAFCRDAKEAGLEFWASPVCSPHIKSTDITALVLEKHKQLQQVSRA